MIRLLRQLVHDLDQPVGHASAAAHMRTELHATGWHSITDLAQAWADAERRANHLEQQLRAHCCLPANDPCPCGHPALHHTTIGCHTCPCTNDATTVHRNAAHQDPTC